MNLLYCAMDAGQENVSLLPSFFLPSLFAPCLVSAVTVACNDNDRLTVLPQWHSYVIIFMLHGLTVSSCCQPLFTWGFSCAGNPLRFVHKVPHPYRPTRQRSKRRSTLEKWRSVEFPSLTCTSFLLPLKVHKLAVIKRFFENNSGCRDGIKSTKTRPCSDDSYIVQPHSVALAMEHTRKSLAKFPTLVAICIMGSHCLMCKGRLPLLFNL